MPAAEGHEVNIPSLGKSLLALAGLALLAGCCCFGGRRAPPPAPAPIVRKGANFSMSPGFVNVSKVAVLPFHAATELIGSSVADMFVTEILGAGIYELVERSQMGKVLTESELSMAGLSESKAVEVGSLLGAEAVIIGTVDEYGTVQQGASAYPVVGISARMIDCATGKIIWSVDLAERSSDDSLTVSELARAVVTEMMKPVKQRVQKNRRLY